jgi:hypothetical protein
MTRGRGEVKDSYPRAMMSASKMTVSVANASDCSRIIAVRVDATNTDDGNAFH